MQFKIYRIWLGGLLALGLSVVNVNLRAADKPVNIRLGTLAPRGTSYHKSLLAMGEKWCRSLLAALDSSTRLGAPDPP